MISFGIYSLICYVFVSFFFFSSFFQHLKTSCTLSFFFYLTCIIIFYAFFYDVLNATVFFFSFLWKKMCTTHCLGKKNAMQILSRCCFEFFHFQLVRSGCQVSKWKTVIVCLCIFEYLIGDHVRPPRINKHIYVFARNSEYYIKNENISFSLSGSQALSLTLHICTYKYFLLQFALLYLFIIFNMFEYPSIVLSLFYPQLSIFDFLHISKYSCNVYDRIKH